MTEPVAAEAKRPKGKKILSHLEIHPQLGGGHIIKHVYEGYQHEPRSYNFQEHEGSRTAAHIARHAGLPAGGGAVEPGEAQEAE